MSRTGGQQSSTLRFDGEELLDQSDFGWCGDPQSFIMAVKAEAGVAPGRQDLMPLPSIRALILTGLAIPASLSAEAVINEFMAAPSAKRVWWDDAGAARLGTGARWNDKSFSPTSWGTLTLPAGYAFSGLRTDLTADMKGKALSVYVRKEFSASLAQATATNMLVLAVQYNDGFVAYLNGREIARANCGPTNQFTFASQPAYNVSTNSGVVEFYLGPASSWLLTNGNLLAIQAHNAEQPSTPSVPHQITSHTPTPEFRINAGLRVVSDANSTVATNLVGLGAEGGSWRYFVGRVEPSGGVIDMGLATKTFVPPEGEEDDYDQPEEFSDWIELANYGSTAADLCGWSLTDTPDQPARWRFPTNTILQPGQFLLVLCDQRDDANAPAGPATYLHTNFKLEGGGEYLALHDATGRYIDGFSQGYPPQVHYCSFGRDPGNPSTFGYLPSATPGRTNSETIYAARVPAPEYWNGGGEPLPGGIYTTQPVSLYLTCSLPGATVRYTTNGTLPTLGNGFDFSQPLVLSQANDKTGVVVRARAFRSGYLPSETVTHSYLFRQPTALKSSPVLFFTEDPGRSFYAPGGALAIVGGSFVSIDGGTLWMAGGPQSYNNPIGAGPAFEREADLEFYAPSGYYPSNQPPFRATAGLRVSSSPWSRPRLRMSSVLSSPWPTGDPTQKPSFNIYFSGDYGVGGLKYPLFANYPVSEFQHLRLRAGKNDILNPFVTDELMRRLFLDMEHVGPRGLFCSVYVNGVYKGVFNLCERIREQFFQAHYQSEAKWDICYSGNWVDGDSKAFQTLLTALDRDLTVLSNYVAISNQVDVENAADYYLLNIYGATWDWPQNNYAIARERSDGANSRFRLAVWDAEGAFYAIGYGKAVSHNSLISDLLVASGSSLYNQNLPRIFRRLCASPEFRLLFADRVNRHMFNNGILDDRDPDGAGPRTPHLRNRLNELIAEAGNLVQFNSGQALNQSAFNTWMSPTSGRRSYLVGSVAGRRMLRDAGLWPVTEPPVFSQHGGAVAPGFSLSMTSTVAVTNQTATIYYTVDGPDPRLPGGSLHPTAAQYSEPVPIDKVVEVKARARNNVTAEWSPLTQATFAPGVVAADSNNLVVAEMMYHPPAATTAELAAGYSNADDFEFVRLVNIGSMPIELSPVRFTAGITFDMASAPHRYLNPKAGVLLVKSRGAFQTRYGDSFNALVAGEFDGNLSNGGERLQLLGTNSTVIRDFVFDDQAPWPLPADGGGPSLVLAEPFSNPNHADASNWIVSCVPGGLPGGVAPSQTYAAWRGLFWEPVAASLESLSGAAADPDMDGLNNFVEYTLGTNPHLPSTMPAPEFTIWVADGEPRLGLSVRLAQGASEGGLEWECCTDLVNWSPIPGGLELVDVEPGVDGTAVFKYCDSLPLSEWPRRFIRFKVKVP